MEAFYPLLFVLAVGLLSGWWFFGYPGWHRRRLLARPAPANWQDLIARRVPLYAALPPSKQRRLCELVRIFLDEKHFYPCQGFELDDTVRLSIAAWACLLVLEQDLVPYPDLHYILVYPGSFRARHQRFQHDGLVMEEARELLGESWHNGKVILSWQEIEQDCLHPSDGYNVILHEFAHQLDAEDGVSNGAPPMPPARLREWAEVFSREYAALQHALAHHHHTLLDPYAATDPAEFFAVATECFVERPAELSDQHPELFNALAGYYRFDPRPWQAALLSG